MKPTHDNITAFLAGLALVGVLFMAATVHATKPKPPEQEQKQYQDQTAIAKSGSVSVSKSGSSSVSDSVSDAAASASNEGNSLSVETNHKRSAPDTVLVPNNNTANCIAAIGLSGANTGGSFMIGIPMPEKFLWWETQVAACNYEEAADDAAAYGDHETAWFWRCHKKSLYRPFKDKGEKKEQAIKDCHTQMVGPITLKRQLDAVTDQLEFIENERRIEREECAASKERIKEAGNESANRAMEACRK